MLNVDLSDGATTRRPIDDGLVRRVLLGRGLNSLTFLQEVGPEVEPLAPTNPLLFTCGLLTGSEAPSAARVQVSARSPLTGLLGSSSVGGRWARLCGPTGCGRSR